MNRQYDICGRIFQNHSEYIQYAIQYLKKKKLDHFSHYYVPKSSARLSTLDAGLDHEPQSLFEDDTVIAADVPLTSLTEDALQVLNDGLSAEISSFCWEIDFCGLTI